MFDNVFAKDSPEVESVLGTVDTYLRWKNANDSSRKYDIYHPSEFGSCLRKMQYNYYASKGVIQPDGKEELESRVIRLFEKGHNMQSRWERYFTNMGIIRGVWECSNPLCNDFDDNGIYDKTRREKTVFNCKARRYGEDQLCGVFKPDKCVCGSTRFDYHEVSVMSEELNMAGHADIILDFSHFDPQKMNGIIRSFNINNLPQKPVVIDMKTINQKGFDALNQFNEPPSIKYIVQLTIYCFLLDCEYGILVYECKNDSSAIAYKINRNEEIWNAIKSQAKKMKEMSEAKDENGNNLYYLPPPRPLKKTDSECSGYRGKGGCPFRKICHKRGSIWDHPDLENRRKNFYGALMKDNLRELSGQ